MVNSEQKNEGEMTGMLDKPLIERFVQKNSSTLVLKKPKGRPE
jgi:hypothetical protein